MNKIIVITGPTASGKTGLAIRLAQMLDTEIISGDSMQVYRGMDIGTAKASADERAKVKHHLIDILDPQEKFTVYNFIELAREIITDLHSRGKIPVIAGGTGLYIDGLLTNTIFEQYENDNCIRTELELRADREGNGVLHAELTESDPEYAAKISANDRKRIIRALEVYLLTGKTQSEHIASSRLTPPLYDSVIFGLTCMDREVLYRRINARVDQMAQMGLEVEVRALYERGLENTPTAGQAIGYKEFYPYFRGECDLAQVLEQIKQSSRRYAKRQLTWYRRSPAVNWLYTDGLDNNPQDEYDKIVNDAKIILENTKYL